MFRNRKILIAMVALVIVTSAVTFAASAFVFYGWGYFNPKYEIPFNSGSVSIDNIKKFIQVRNILEKSYYEEVDENKLLEGAIAGMSSSLKDPYTAYYSKEDWKRLIEETSGSIVGIGAIITMDNNGLYTIVEVTEGNPAKKAGLMQGDVISKVDDRDASTVSDLTSLVSLIKGESGTKVKINVFRPSEQKFIDFTITRAKVKVENIKSEVLQGNIGYIRIVEFDEEIASYFENHLNALLSKGIKGLIIDVRDNPGGYYSQVVKIADRLLPSGLIVYREDRYKKRSEETSDARELKMPIAVLINGRSASASEILAGALKDHQKATLVGTKTFGKGLVQDVIGLEDGSGLKVTTSRYFTPSGVCIQGIGIEPDEASQLADKYKNSPVSIVPRDKDYQLGRAIDIIKKQIK